MDMQFSVHPVRKNVNGERAAENSTSEVYKIKPNTWRAPEYQRAEFVNGKAIVHFTHVNDGHHQGWRHHYGFCIVGPTKNSIGPMPLSSATLSSEQPSCTSEVAVRYAFGYKHVPWANLFGANNRPVLIFRSDDWIDVP